ncbi:MAG: S1/P1 Nuclease [Flavobacteriaceae bacterium]|nr:MAG: S1/P1 Nuclease [Flavobacteriaceae bacterium]
MNFRILLVGFFLITGYTTKATEIVWGKTGHRTVGVIASKHLTHKAKRKIRKLLKGQSLAFVSTFADEIKSDKKYNRFYTWHFINMPLDSNYKESDKNPAGDLVTGIDTCINIIKNNSEEDRAFYLKMLIHLIGDLHQPLHIGRKEDRGGNRVQVKWFGRKTNLHSVWDTKMIEGFKMSYKELADNADLLSKAQIKAIQQGSIIDWVGETHILTKKIYASVEEDEDLRYRYSYDYLTTARTQIQKAGIRLAKVLNDIFK